MKLTTLPHARHVGARPRAVRTLDVPKAAARRHVGAVLDQPPELTRGFLTDGSPRRYEILDDVSGHTYTVVRFDAERVEVYEDGARLSPPPNVPLRLEALYRWAVEAAWTRIAGASLAAALSGAMTAGEGQR